MKITLYTALFSSLLLCSIFFISRIDGRTMVVFCDVGQGDGVYMRIKNHVDVIIDAGPDNSILECLGKHMPFFDRTIELGFITHPQKDHYFGFLSIGKRYTIKSIFMNPLDSENDSFKELKEIFKKNNTTIVFPQEGTQIEILKTKFNFLWPTKQYLSDNIDPQVSSVMGNSSLDPNFFSLIFTFEENHARFLFTGDSSEEVLNRLVEKSEIKTTVLKVPHHGSKNGLTQQFLRLADPTLSVISSGKNNRYGHPSKEIISMFETMKKKYLRTDVEGTIVFKINDKGVERMK